MYNTPNRQSPRGDFVDFESTIRIRLKRRSENFLHKNYVSELTEPIEPSRAIRANRANQSQNQMDGWGDGW